MMNKAYHLQNIRALLNEGFSESELRDLCFDEPHFRPVHEKLADSDGKAEIISHLLEYAHQRLLLDQLLAIVKQLNPARYEAHQPYQQFGRDLIGQSLGKYQLIKQLGRGGMAEVYQAHDPVLDRYVAIKVINTRLSEHEEFVKRFHNEARTVANLRHDNIIRVIDYAQSDDIYYIVMEYIEGYTLERKLKQYKTQNQLPSLTETSRIFNQLASALDHAHSKGIVHRDIKPSNILFTTTEQVILTDFGIARMTHIPGQTLPDAAPPGTPAYMSPEQARGKSVDRRSDIYALGVLLFEMTTGDLPFMADPPWAILVQHLKETPPLPSALNPHIPPPVERVILKALSKKPVDRFQTAGEMVEALAAALAKTGISPDQDEQPTIPSILTPVLATTGYGKLESQPRHDIPFQAPPDRPHFVGREAELAHFRELLRQPGEQNIYCLTGMGGLGKTSLAIHLAHALRDDFPDGVLWANTATSESLAILDSWGRAYGYDFSALPDLASRAAALRGELVDKKALLIFDDVQWPDQVRPLLPGGSTCTVLLTTRNLELAVALDAYEFRLAVLAPAESRQLLADIAGNERVAAEEAFANEICRLLGHLPLAVAIAARRLASRRRWRLTDLAERLRDEKSRLTELKMSDREVRASFAVSWAALNEQFRRTFALLAVFEGRPFTTPALAAVAEVNLSTAENDLYNLVTLSLVAEEGQIYYRQHPLLTDFAREQLGEDKAAYRRMAQYYLSYATEHQHNYSALEQEWENVLAGMAVAYQQQSWPEVIAYAEVLTEVWLRRGHLSDARQGYRWASEAAGALEDHPHLAAILQRWGQACIEQGDYAEAKECLSHSLQLYQEIGNRVGVASAQYYLGRVAIEKAEYDQAQQLLDESRRIREQLHDQLGVAETLYQQANIQYNYSNYEQAELLAKQALDVQQGIGDKLGCIRTLNLLADIALELDNPSLGESYCRQALALCEEIGEQDELAVVLYILARVYRDQGDLIEARPHAEKSLDLLKLMGDRKMQANVLWRLSLIDADLKNYTLALDESLNSLKLHRDLGDTWGSIYVLLHLGNIYQALDQPDQAQAVWREGLSLTETLPQHPLIESLRQRLQPNRNKK